MWVLYLEKGTNCSINFNFNGNNKMYIDKNDEDFLLFAVEPAFEATNDVVVENTNTTYPHIQADNSDITPRHSIFNKVGDDSETNIEQPNLNLVGVCSGYGAYHTDNGESKKPQSYDLIVFDAIKRLVDKPQPPKEKDGGQWIIPSTEKSRVHSVHKMTGQYLYLWGDIDYKDTTDCRTIEEVGSVVSSITGGADFEIWATRGATHDKQKCRILIRLERLLNSSEWLDCQELLFEKLGKNGIEDDEATLRYGQVCYLPNPGKFYSSVSVREGNFFNPLTVWSDELKEKETSLKFEEEAIRTSNKKALEERKSAVIEVGDDALPDAKELFKAQYRIEELLFNSGQYEQRGKTWKGGNATGFSGTIFVDNGVQKYVTLSANGDPLNEKNTGCGAHDAFSVLMHLNHNGDYKSAIKDVTENYLMVGDRTYAEVARELWKKKNKPKCVNETVVYADGYKPASVVLDSNNVLNGKPMPFGFRLDTDSLGSHLNTYTNVATALKTPTFCGLEFAYDDFLDDTVIREAGGNWESVKEKHYYMIPHLLKRLGFKEVSIKTAKDSVRDACFANEVDTGKIWAESLVWDGIPRVAGFLHNYLNTADTEYATAVSNYIWSGMANRLLVPGCQLDMMPIFKSKQGTKKTSTIMMFAPNDDYFETMEFDENEVERSKKFRGTTTVEIAELKGLNTRSAEDYKAFITKRKESIRKLYVEKHDYYHRRAMLFGTTNEDFILADPTGERRYLPIVVGDTDAEALARDKEQLWAEGIHIFKTKGQQWQDAQRLAELEHHKFKITDPWQDVIVDFISNKQFPIGDFRSALPRYEFYATNEILQFALGIKVENFDKRKSDRVGCVMRVLGYKQGWDTRVGEERKKRWKKIKIK